jgi:undecaprenyl phosphate-alpha-L-ara4N flippase subunit ArnE
MRRSTRGILLLGLSIVLQSFSFLCIKYASMHTGLATVALLGLAGVFLISRAVVWQNVLGLVDLSAAYPFNSLVQVLIFLYAVFLFGETVGLHHIVGLALMLCGLTLLARQR